MPDSPFTAATRRAVPTVVVLGLLTVAPLSAQEDPPAHAGPPATVLERLEAGQRLRVQLLEGERRAGHVRGVRGDSILLGGADPAWVRRSEVERIWTRGSRVKVGAIAGGSAGLVAGAFIGGVLGELACGDREDGCTVEAALAFGGLSAATSAGLGAVVGLLIPRWKQQWP